MTQFAGWMRRKRVWDKILPMGRPCLLQGQSGTGLPHSTTLRAPDSPPHLRQVLECVRGSAAFPLAPAVLSGNLYTNFTLIPADAKRLEEFCLTPLSPDSPRIFLSLEETRRNIKVMRRLLAIGNQTPQIV